MKKITIEIDDKGQMGSNGYDEFSKKELNKVWDHIKNCIDYEIALKEAGEIDLDRLRSDIWDYVIVRGLTERDKTLQNIEERLLVFSELKLDHYPPSQDEINDLYEREFEKQLEKKHSPSNMPRENNKKADHSRRGS